MSQGRPYKMVGGPLDGDTLAFHEGTGYVCAVNLQPDPGGTPIIGHAHYEFASDGRAYYLHTTVDWNPKGKDVP